MTVNKVVAVDIVAQAGGEDLKTRVIRLGFQALDRHVSKPFMWFGTSHILSAGSMVFDTVVQCSLVVECVYVFELIFQSVMYLMS